MYDTPSIPYNTKRGAGAIIRDIAEGYIRVQLGVKMAASLRILAKGKLSTMQPALRAIVTRTCPAVFSRGLSLTSKLNSSLFASCLDWERK